MTRTEAIGLLSALMFKGKLKEALDMAIKALEQEPTTKNDLGVDKTFYEQIVEYCNEHFLVLVEKDVWEDAINTMRKYEKIEQILDDCDLEAWEVLEKIKEVVEDGKGE